MKYLRMTLVLSSSTGQVRGVIHNRIFSWRVFQKKTNIIQRFGMVQKISFVQQKKRKKGFKEV